MVKANSALIASSYINARSPLTIIIHSVDDVPLNIFSFDEMAYRKLRCTNATRLSIQSALIKFLDPRGNLLVLSLLREDLLRDTARYNLLRSHKLNSKLKAWRYTALLCERICDLLHPTIIDPNRFTPREKLTTKRLGCPMINGARQPLSPQTQGASCGGY